MRYDRWWRARGSRDHFGERISRAWVDEYITFALADPADLVEVDPGNGFRYTFDLAGTMRGDTAGREPRVIGVWGYSVERECPGRFAHARPSAPERSIG